MRMFVGVFPARGIFLNQDRALPLPPSPRLFFLGRARIGYAHRNKVDREDERRGRTDGAFFPPRPPKRATMWARYNVMGVIRKEEGLN